MKSPPTSTPPTPQNLMERGTLVLPPLPLWLRHLLWKPRKAIETNDLGAAGLVSTNSIRGGKNRKVLEAICDTTRTYEAWSDEGWVNEGAAVRVSLIAFGHASQAAAPTAALQAGLVQGVGAISKSEAYEPPPPAPARPGEHNARPSEHNATRQR